MRAVKRKSGNKAYYSLQHSYRKGGKVVTREIYLGDSIPKDLKKKEEIFLKELRDEQFGASIEKIRKGFQAEWRRYPASAKEKELKEIAIAFSYNTNAIEGSTITLPETRELLEKHIAPNRPISDVKEMERHAKVFLAMLQRKERISRDLLLGWHKEIFSETQADVAGKFRRYLVRVGSYAAPDWQDIGKLIGDVVDFCNKRAKMSPVELVARAHYRFEKAHPFTDGNGRIGRLIMNHMLWHSGYPMIIIEYRKRKAYYRAFEKGEENFLKYFLRLYLKIHAKYLKKLV